MKKPMEKAQDYLDAGEPVPPEIIDSLSREESELLDTLRYFKENLKHELDSLVEDTPMHLKREIPVSEDNNTSTYSFRKFLIAAAAVILLLSAPGIYRTVETRRLVKEDTLSFVGAITDTAWAENADTPDDELDTEWFNAEPIVLVDLY